MKKYRRLWAVVKEIVLANYDVLAKRTMRGSYYIVGDLLAQRIGKEITIEDYNWFCNEQGYASYRDDIWPQIEQRFGLQRPEAAPVGVVYDNGLEYPISRLESVWEQSRGFIFVEKADEARDLKPLSNYGWTIVAGKGYPTRLIRKLLKEDGRPVLVLHDWDPDGLGIYRALGFETRRTRHLKIALCERVIDLGLSEEHVKALNLPTRPSPPKYRGAPRVELSALAVLSARMGLENPVLAYAVASMLARGLKLSPLEVPKAKLLAKYLRWALTDALHKVVDEVSEELARQQAGEGTAVSGEVAFEGFEGELRSEALKEALKALAREVAKSVRWRGEEDYHEEALRLTSEELVEVLKRGASS